MPPLAEPFRRYLMLLQADEEPPGLDYLRRLVHAQICRVPFENVSKVLLFGREGSGRPATIDEYLDGIEHFDLGGTCYSANPFFAELLRAVGFDAGLFGADMSTPNVHTVIRVRIAGRAYHVDAGYGGPFREPLCLEDLPHEICEGELRYRVEGGGQEVAVSVYSGGERTQGYRAHEPPRAFDFFRQIILDSFLPGKTFMTHLRIVRIFARHSAELFDQTLTVHREGSSRTQELGSMAELRRAVEDDLAMPRCPVDEAIEVLERLRAS
jgi:N-hydroxyarylamine O-acetyltransferase